MSMRERGAGVAVAGLLVAARGSRAATALVGTAGWLAAPSVAPGGGWQSVAGSGLARLAALPAAPATAPSAQAVVVTP